MDIEENELITQFYLGFDQETRISVDSFTYGLLLSSSNKEAMDTLSELLKEIS